MAPRPHSYLHCPLAYPRWALGCCVSSHFIPILPSTTTILLVSRLSFNTSLSLFWSATAWPNSVYLTFEHLRLQYRWDFSHPGGAAEACSRIHWGSATCCWGSSMLCMWSCRGIAWLWHRASIRCQVSLRFHSVLLSRSSQFFIVGVYTLICLV